MRRSSLKYTHLTLAAGLVSLGATTAQADIQHLDDVIITFSLCVGNDCNNGENFGFDTMRLKENNLRIHFDDTSSTGSFPSNDWRLVANDSSNGGASYLAIEDSTAGRIPFRVEAGAPSNALYVDDNGNIGLGTSTPVVPLHVVDGNTPTLRLEQNGSSGFTAQTWDIAGNEANFFIRDVTNGSKLSFRIEPNAPESSLYIDSTGDIGLGDSSPDAALDIDSGNLLMNNGSVLVNGDGSRMVMTDTAAAFSAQIELAKNGTPRIRFDNTAVDVAPGSGGDVPQEWDIGLDGNAKFLIRSLAQNNNAFLLDDNGNLTIAGALTQSSDKNAKMAIVPVDGAEILSKVQALPIAAWSYKDDANVRHIGPMAQDFYALFGTGAGETGISTLDTSGVALAAIKALSQENAAQQDLIAHLSARLEALEGQIAK